MSKKTTEMNSESEHTGAGRQLRLGTAQGSSRERRLKSYFAVRRGEAHL